MGLASAVVQLWKACAMRGLICETTHIEILPRHFISVRSDLFLAFNRTRLGVIVKQAKNMVSKREWALITGISRGGLGDGLAKELLANGTNVIITGLRLKDLDYFTNTTISKLEKVELDVTRSASISAAVSATHELAGGRLDILINNAGYGYMMPLLDADMDAIRKNFEVNVFGLLAVTQAFFPLLREAGGVVVNQASIAGLPNVCQPYIGP